MTLAVGTPAPPITGTDMVKNAPWALSDIAGHHVLAASSAITWCPACQYEAPFLEAVWKQLSGKTTEPFTMAIVSGGWTNEENPAALQTAIAQYGITFPVVFSVPQFSGFNYWRQSQSDISATPTVCCLRWDAEARRHVVGSSYTAALDEEGLLELLHRCGV